MNNVFTIGTCSKRKDYKINMSSMVQEPVQIYNVILNILAASARDSDIDACQQILTVCNLLSRNTQGENLFNNVARQIVIDNLFK